MPHQKREAQSHLKGKAMPTDYGVVLNTKIAKARKRAVEAYDRLCEAENELSPLEVEREDARKECGKCNDCSMCLP